MSIHHSAINNHHSAITLPSVESWGINMNILRDPPKGIMTRKKVRVGDLNDLNFQIDESADRTSEAINVYARGVNPFVEVSFGNNTSSFSGNLTTGGQTQTSLPYKIFSPS